MPVSHLALTVSHLPDAAEFYTKALKPLGYHFIAQELDGTVGLGIVHADFFLIPEKDGHPTAPTHIAFAADSRRVVRECYAASLNAGARRSGAPDYRESDDNCFNAAVEDLDGNTIEFIYREGSHAAPAGPTSVPSEYTSATKQHNNHLRNEERDHVGRLNSVASKAQSTAQNALALASSVSKSLAKPDVRIPETSHSTVRLSQPTANTGGNAIVGGLLGAAAGAALAYAMVRSERDSAAEEKEFAMSMRRRATEPPTSETRSKKSDRTHSSTILSRSARRTIEPSSFTGIDADTRYTYATRPLLPPSRTYGAIEHKAHSSSSASSHRRHHVKRASTLPIGLIENHAGNHRRRRSLDGSQSSRRDSVISMHSHRPRRSSFSKVNSSRSAKRSSHYESAANIPLPASRAASYMSGSGDRMSRASKSPSYVTAAQVPLPQSRTTSYVSRAEVPTTQPKAQSYISGAQIPIPPSNFTRYTERAEESDGIGDLETIVPDDSISCVDFSKPRKKSSSKHGSTTKSSRHSSKRSEADSERTVRPAKPSESRHSNARTLPVREKEREGAGSKYSAARTLPAREKEKDHFGSRAGRRSMATQA